MTNGAGAGGAGDAGGKKKKSKKKPSPAKTGEAGPGEAQAAPPQQQVEVPTGQAPLAKPPEISEERPTEPPKGVVEEGQTGFKGVVEAAKGLGSRIGTAITGQDPKVEFIANTDNRIFNTAAEYMANNPLTTAWILTGVGGLIKGTVTAAGSIVGKQVVGKAGKLTASQIAKGAGLGGMSALERIATMTKYPANTKNAKLTAGILAKTAAQLKKPAFVMGAIGAAIGTYPWAEWALGEAKEGMIFNTQKAINTGDAELIAEVQRQSEEIFDVKVWENIQRSIPMVNIAFAFGQKSKALQAQWAVNNRIMQDEIIKIQNGESDDDMWTRILKDKREQEQRAREYYDKQAKASELWRSEFREGFLKGEFDEVEWEAERKKVFGDQFQRRHWGKGGGTGKKKKEEEEELDNINRFYIQYVNTRMRMMTHTRPGTSSNLGFGLF